MNDDGVRPRACVALAALAALGAALDDLGAVDPRHLAGPELDDVLVGVDVALRRLDGVRARLLPILDDAGRWALDGSRSLAAWLRRTTGSSAPEAWRTVRTARALRDHLPITAAALDEGALTAEHARLLATHATKTPERIAALAHPSVGEAFLVEQARRLDAGDFAKVLRAWAVAADPDGADAGYAEDVERQELVLAKVLHGYHLQGWLGDADGAVLEAALAAVVGVPDASDGRTTAQRRAAALVTLARLALDSGELMPGASIRPHLTVHVPHETLLALAAAQAPASAAGTNRDDAPDGPAGDAEVDDAEDAGDAEAGAAAMAADVGDADDGGEVTPEAGPTPRPDRGVGRPFSEPGRFGWTRGAGDAVATAAPGRASRGLGPPGPSVIPGELNHAVLVGAVPAELDDHTPIPPALLARLACDSELARVVFGPAGEVLDVGRAQRLFTPGQRRAVIARDRRCAFPGCDAPPQYGEIHHSIWWYAQHGRTRVKDGVLLCWAHHDYVHAHRITITRSPASVGPARDAGWTFTRPNGRVVTARRDERGRAPVEARGRSG